jgi:hypothetical protein
MIELKFDASIIENLSHDCLNCCVSENREIKGIVSVQRYFFLLQIFEKLIKFFERFIRFML